MYWGGEILTREGSRLSLHALIVDDGAGGAELMAWALQRAGFDLEWGRVDSEEALLAALTPDLDVVLADDTLAALRARRVVEMVNTSGIDAPVILVTGPIREAEKVAYLKEGAAAHLPKDNLDRLGEVVRDALEDRKLREEVRTAQKRYRDLVESVPAVVYTAEPGEGGRWLYVSPQIEDLLGYSPEEWTADPTMWFRRIHPDDRASVMEAEGNLVDTFHSDQPEYRMIARDGRVVWVRDQARYLEDGSGGVFHGFMIDVTARKQAEEELHQSELRKQALFESSFDCVIIADHEGRILEFNPAAERTFGYRREEVVGRLLAETIVPPSLREAHAAGFKRFLDTRRPTVLDRRVEVSGMRSDGSEFPVELAITLLEADEEPVFVAYLRDLTERREMEDSRHASEQRFRSLIQNAHDVVSITDASGVNKYMSPGIERLLGYRPEELVGSVGMDFLHPDDLELAASIGAEILSSEGSVRTNEIRARHRNGSWIWLEFTVSNQLSDPSIQGIVANFHDITERKEAEARHQAQSEILRMIAEGDPLENTMSELVKTVEKLGNDAVCLVMLLDESGERLELVAGPSVPTKLKEAMGSGVSIGATGTPCGFAASSKRLFVSSDIATDPRLEGSREISLSAGLRSAWSFPIRSSSGDSLLGTFCVYHKHPGEPTPSDLETADRAAQLAAIAIERASTDRAVRHSEEKFRALFATNPMPMWVWDRESLGFLAVNAAATEKYGYSEEEFLQMRLTDIRPRDEVSPLLDYLGERQRPVRGNAGTRRHVTKDGRVLEVEVHWQSIDFEDRDAALAVVHDVTERNQSEGERRKLEQQLRQAQKMESIGRLAGGIAHDFNNLLAVIINYASFLEDEFDRSDPRREDLEEIKRAGERGANLVRQLLAFSRKEVMEPRNVDLNDIVSDTEKLLKRTIGEDVDLQIVAREGLWITKVDPGQVEQVLMNLAVNARDAMPDGGSLVLETSNVVVDEVHAKRREGLKEGDYTCLTVSDTGRGMTDEIRAQIFEPFFTTKKRGEGTGLGLATVYGIVKQLNGYISCYSELEHGTTFRIYFPVARDEAEPMGRSPKQTGAKGEGETVLLVEDEAPVRNLVARVLTRGGYKVVPAASAEEALDLYHAPEGGADLLLTDVIMPGMSGKELSERLAIGNRVPTLYMSGYTDSIIAKHGVLEEGAAFIQKPFNANDLLEKVREVLAQ
jgi:two-component system cell cycle sensor histidine kinase/response regulator CckA